MLNRLRAVAVRLAVTLTAASLRAPALFVTAALLATVALGAYVVRNVGMDTSTEEMLDPQLRFLALDREFERLFPVLDDPIVVVVEAPSLARAHAAADRVAARMGREPERLREVYRPGGGPWFARHGLLYMESEALWELNDRLAEAEPFLGTLANDPSARGLFTLMERALGEDLGPANEAMLAGLIDRVADTLEARAAGGSASVSWLDAWAEGEESGSGPARAFVLAQPAGTDASAALEATRALLGEPGLLATDERARLTGALAMETEELENVEEDARFTTLIAFALVLLMLIAAFRSLRTMLALLVTLAAGLVWTGAFATAAIGSLNLISVSFAVLFIGMGVDFGIQFAMRYREELAAGSLDAGQALLHAATGVGGALALAALIAAVSFLAFTPTDYRGLAELGFISAFSMLVALVANLTLLPALLALMRVERFAPTLSGAGMRGLGAWVPRHRGLLLSVALLALALGALFIPRASFDFNPLNLRDPTTEAVQTFRDLLADTGSSPYTIDIVAEDLAAARRLAETLEALPEVAHALTVESYVPGGQQEKLEIVADMRSVLQSLLFEGAGKPPPLPAENRAALAALRERIAGASQAGTAGALGAGMQRLERALAHAAELDDPGLAELDRALVGDFPQLLERLRELLSAGPVALEDLPAALRARYVTADGRARVEVFPVEDLSDNAALGRFVRAVQGVTDAGSGSPVSLLEGGRVVVESCLQATLLALAATVALTLATLGSLGAAVLALVPLALALSATLASSVLLGLPFNLANIIALPLLIGLANAYGIYIVMRARSEGGVAGLYASSTPGAVLFSGLTTIASFGTLGLARHPGMAYMGLLVALALGFALLFTLLVLPGIMASLEALRRRRAGRRP